MHYLTLVRNITDNIDKNTIDNLKTHLRKSKIDHGYVIVKEISPANKQLHLHAILACHTIEDRIALEKYIDTHHLKRYVDKYNVIQTFNEVKLYLAYMMKDLSEDSKRYINYDHKDIGRINWIDHNKKLYRLVMGKKKPSTDDDPFIDSDTERLIQ